MLFMVIERFRPGRAPDVYRRFHWEDLVDFEIVPVRTSEQAARAIAAEPSDAIP